MYNAAELTLQLQDFLLHIQRLIPVNFLQQADWDANPSLAISTFLTDISLSLSDSLYMSVSIYVPEGERKDEM